MSSMMKRLKSLGYKKTVKNCNVRKFKSPWYNSECEDARRKLKEANKMYRKKALQEMSFIYIRETRS